MGHAFSVEILSITSSSAPAFLSDSSSFRPEKCGYHQTYLWGRDIKRYKAEFADSWLIATFPVLQLDIDNYPAVKQYLSKFLPKIKQTGEEFINQDGKNAQTRKKTRNKWFETQDQIGYY